MAGVVLVRVEDNSKNNDICRKFCGDCPSYPKSGELLFCAKGKSAKTIAKNGCLCPGCDVFEKYNLDFTYFCDVGAAE